MENFRIKKVLTWDGLCKRVRLFRIMWERNAADIGKPCIDEAYSAALSFAIDVVPGDLWIGVFWKRQMYETFIYVCFVPCLPIRIHFQRSWGGKYV
jgi:hypothetical protein